ncbi:MAG TPA: DNA-binding domain-containing protein [Sphingorhabdus sp.]|nr:DNA-binding domain-containing protein [Sphingorhabdus sp.]
MPSLSDAQRNFIATLNEGPDTLDPALFAGAPERVLLGLKAHANTISHARLVALEESFPLTRGEMGEERFNTLSREYVETAPAKASDLAHIGRHFAPFPPQLATLPQSNGHGWKAIMLRIGHR